MKKRDVTIYSFAGTGGPVLEVTKTKSPTFEIASGTRSVILDKQQARDLLAALKEELEPHVGQPCCPEGAVGEKGVPGEATAPKDRRRGSQDRRSSDKPVYTNRRKSLLVDRRRGLPDRRESILLDRRGVIDQVQQGD